jgi:hypothetical protein
VEKLKMTLLREGVEEIFALHHLAELILKEFAKENTDYVYNIVNGHFADFYDKLIKKWVRLDNLSNNVGEKYEQKLAPIFDGGIWVYISPSIEGSGLGVFTPPNKIKIKHTPQLKEILRELIDIDESVSDSREYITPRRAELALFYALKRSLMEILVHELQHCLDYFRSSGAFVKDQKSIDYYKKRGDRGKPIPYELWGDYLSLPHEYWARFSQTLLRFYPTTDLKTDIKDFKTMFDGWKYLEEKDKRRLIKAFLKWREIAEKEGDENRIGLF